MENMHTDVRVWKVNALMADFDFPFFQMAHPTTSFLPMIRF